MSGDFADDEARRDERLNEAEAVPDPGEANEDVVVTHVPPAPQVAWSLHMDQCSRSVTHLPDGGRLLHFTAIEFLFPPGQAPVPRHVGPQVVIVFGPEGWEKFQIEMANDGVDPDLAKRQAEAITTAELAAARAKIMSPAGMATRLPGKKS